MSYDFSAFCGNVIQLTAKETFPPEPAVFAGRRAGAHTAGTERCPAWRAPRQSCPKGSAAACQPARRRQRAGMSGRRSHPRRTAGGPVVRVTGNQKLQETEPDFS